ncbi:pyridoxamine 5'-phosphate oxidase family protein [Pseudomaricurvus alkylphenolicus]|jgi:nitroimidazol reductase NimA-like FMN-containing flavoprotein (pyridoxamine 5'-phosphate oxidase superfamily)|uniref:pyridoxamine 5'-phosphate oxidase family protein n=1 Tax=Pseudomaricurvus alkylphenolicus TaxID=1306991 RepID=UPI001421C54A|nr:pyridoxamine 5'-phosphate oxidase family protein [Pseudomaricurvus alkylphenolicus]NIB44962.1 pyridoxamine 5'-phosphate oxidase family protein [Pseudomaricurvus alkylphenolicus]
MDVTDAPEITVESSTTSLPDSRQTFAPSPRSRVRHGAKRASYRLRDIYQLVDDLKLGHVGFVQEGQVFVIPITLWRVNDHLYFHCANKGRLQKLLEAGEQVCISLAECTEWVLTKSAYHHSANYRSAVVYCQGERVTEAAEFDHAFEVIINQLETDRWSQVRPPNAIERKATALMKLEILDGSFKSRSGGPNEEPEDMALPVWHGTVPVCPFHPR